MDENGQASSMLGLLKDSMSCAADLQKACEVTVRIRRSSCRFQSRCLSVWLVCRTYLHLLNLKTMHSRPTMG